MSKVCGCVRAPLVARMYVALEEWAYGITVKQEMRVQSRKIFSFAVPDEALYAASADTLAF